ncbi:MAG: hypothetical protein Q7S01_06520 [bacterium]|nr:hypothetical protein [bacterium]
MDLKKSFIVLSAILVLLAILVAGAFLMQRTQQQPQNINFVGTVTDKKENAITVDRLEIADNDLKKTTIVPQTVEITETTKFVQRVLKDKEQVRREFASSTPSSRASNPISFFTEKPSTFDSVAIGAKVAVTASENAFGSTPSALEVKVLPEEFSVTDPLGIPRAAQSER